MTVKTDVPTVLTGIVVGIWTVSFFVRIKNPAWSGGSSLDASVLLVMGYWFTIKAIGRKNGAPKP
jgi:hypothetical protein